MTEVVQTAIIAGVSAMGGGLVASLHPIILHFLEARKERHRLSREKLERISMLVGDSVDYVGKLTSAKSFEELVSMQQCESLRESLTIAGLYFPELLEPIAVYHNHMIHLYTTIIDCADPTSALPPIAGAARSQEYHKLCRQGMDLRQKVDEAILSIAPDYTKA